MYPSFIHVNKDFIKTDLNKFFSKSLVVWVNESIDENGKLEVLEKFLEYDYTGIMVYIKNDNSIFILTTPDRKNVADFMVSNLKRN